MKKEKKKKSNCELFSELDTWTFFFEQKQKYKFGKCADLGL